MSDIRDINEDLVEDTDFFSVIEKKEVSITDLHRQLSTVVSQLHRIYGILFTAHMWSQNDPIIISQANPTQNAAYSTPDTTKVPLLIKSISLSASGTAEVVVQYISPQSIGSPILIVDLFVGPSPVQQFIGILVPAFSKFQILTKTSAITGISCTIDTTQLNEIPQAYHESRYII